MAYDPEDDVEEPPQLRRLRILVMALMVVLMLGIVTIAVTIVIRLGFVGEGTGGATVPQLRAEAVALPEGAEITALGQGAQGLLVSIRLADGRELLRVHDAVTGALVQETVIQRE